MSRIRLSPSGKVLETIGVGAQLRFVELRSTVSSDVQVIPSAPASVGFVVGVAPALDLGFSSGVSSKDLYRATMVMDVTNTSNVASNVQFDLYADWGDGLGFQVVALSNHSVAGGTTRQMRVDCPPTAPPAAVKKAIFEARVSNDLDAIHVKIVSPSTGATIDFQVSELQSS